MSSRTKEWIGKTIIELMDEMPIAEIRVTDICKAADISGPTFYYHFQDKYDALEWFFFHGFAYEAPISPEALALRLESMKKKSRKFYKRIYEDHSQNRLLDALYENMVVSYSSFACKVLQAETLPHSLHLRICFWAHGVMGTIREWFFSDQIGSALEVAQAILDSLPEPLASASASSTE